MACCQELGQPLDDDWWISRASRPHPGRSRLGSVRMPGKRLVGRAPAGRVILRTEFGVPGLYGAAIGTGFVAVLTYVDCNAHSDHSTTCGSPATFTPRVWAPTLSPPLITRPCSPPWSTSTRTPSGLSTSSTGPGACAAPNGAPRRARGHRDRCVYRGRRRLAGDGAPLSVNVW